jgi:nucleoside-diphosphate-sugar epimerase
MKVAITGGTGFIGSHCVSQAVAAGHEVKMLVRNPSKAYAALKLQGLKPHTVEMHEVDLRDHSALRASLAGADAVIHSAAVFSLNPLEEQAMQEFNPTSTRVILEEATVLGLDPVVYVSTSGAFMPLSGGPIGSNTEISTGCGPYTRSKIAAEHIARRQQSIGEPVVCIYPGGVIGPRDPNRELTDSMSLVTRILGRNTVLVPEGARLAMVDVRDVAAVCLGALERGRGPRRYHIWGSPISLREMVEIINRVTGRDIRLRRVPLLAVDIGGILAEVTTRIVRRRLPLCLETARLFTQNVRSGGPGVIDERPARAEFGYPRYDFEESISDTLRWLAGAGHLNSDQAGLLALS